MELKTIIVAGGGVITPAVPVKRQQELTAPTVGLVSGSLTPLAVLTDKLKARPRKR